jgi:hypothetical protein
MAKEALKNLRHCDGEAEAIHITAWIATRLKPLAMTKIRFFQASPNAGD